MCVIYLTLCRALLILCIDLLKVQMFVMLLVMSAGHLLELMNHQCCFHTSLMLLGVVCVAMATTVIIITPQCTFSYSIV